VISLSMKDTLQQAMDWMKEFSKTNPEQMKSFQKWWMQSKKKKVLLLIKKLIKGEKTPLFCY